MHRSTLRVPNLERRGNIAIVTGADQFLSYFAFNRHVASKMTLRAFSSGRRSFHGLPLVRVGITASVRHACNGLMKDLRIRQRIACFSIGGSPPRFHRCTYRRCTHAVSLPAPDLGRWRRRVVRQNHRDRHPWRRVVCRHHHDDLDATAERRSDVPI